MEVDQEELKEQVELVEEDQEQQDHQLVQEQLTLEVVVEDKDVTV